VTCMRRRSCARAWLITSSLSHIATLKFRQNDITKNKELQKETLVKFHQFPSSHSLGRNSYGWRSVLYGIDWVELGKVGLG
jgi:hypothetical protein